MTMARDTAAKRSKPNDISVLVCGAGVGGLMVAMECWRHGCDVRVLERTDSSSALGDTFTIGPTALNAFRNWPDMEKRNEEIAYHPLFATHTHTGERVKGPMEMSDMYSQTTQTRPKIVRHSRPKFHAMLLEQVHKLHIPIDYGCEVVDYFEDATTTHQAGVVLKDGSRHTADLVVAADGLRSASRSLIAGEPVPARRSGNATFRVAYPVEIALADPVVAERFPLREDGRSVLEMWAGAGMYALFWRNQDQMCWSINHPDHGTAEESWSHRASISEALKYTSTIPDWPEVADRVIKATPPGLVVDWKLMWRDPQPKWTSPGGRVVQLGDAAHTFLPSSGNGGTQAIEDAISLAACVALSGKFGIPDATRVHNILRFERVSCLQALGVANREARVGKNVKRENLTTHSGVGKWFVEHDPEQYVFDNYDKALASIQQGTGFKNTNIPPGLEYKPWTIDGLVSAIEKGEPSILGGNWTG